LDVFLPQNPHLDVWLTINLSTTPERHSSTRQTWPFWWLLCLSFSLQISSDPSTGKQLDATLQQKQPPSDQDIFRQLSRLSQKRYLKLRKIQRSIAANYQRFTPTSQGLLENHLKKIDHLIKIYLNLLALKERHEHFLQSTTEENIAQTITALKEDMADDPPRIRAIKERRLEKRLNRIKKARENLEILEAQLATIEDVIQYIHDQSLTMRNPEELTFQLDTLLSEAEETEAIVQELEDIFSSTPTLQDPHLYVTKQTHKKLWISKPSFTKLMQKV